MTLYAHIVASWILDIHQNLVFAKNESNLENKNCWKFKMRFSFFSTIHKHYRSQKSIKSSVPAEPIKRQPV